MVFISDEVSHVYLIPFDDFIISEVTVFVPLYRFILAPFFVPHFDSSLDICNAVMITVVKSSLLILTLHQFWFSCGSLTILLLMSHFPASLHA